MKYRTEAGKEIDHTVDASGVHTLTYDDGTEQVWPNDQGVTNFLSVNGYKPVPESEDDSTKAAPAKGKTKKTADVSDDN